MSAPWAQQEHEDFHRVTVLQTVPYMDEHEDAEYRPWVEILRPGEAGNGAALTLPLFLFRTFDAGRFELPPDGCRSVIDPNRFLAIVARVLDLLWGPAVP